MRCGDDCIVIAKTEEEGRNKGMGNTLLVGVRSWTRGRGFGAKHVGADGVSKKIGMKEEKVGL